jgi:two-component system sensor histidine kinase KdpD
MKKNTEDLFPLSVLMGSKPAPSARNFFHAWKSYCFALVVLVLCNALAWMCKDFLALTNLLMIYLIGILVVVFKFGIGPSAFACVLGVLSFDFFMVPPRFVFAHSDTQYLITLLVVLAITLTISGLMVRIRFQTETIRVRETRTAALFTLSCKLAACQEINSLLQIAVEHISRIMDCRVILLMPDQKNMLIIRAGQESGFVLNPAEQKAAELVYSSGNIAGRETKIFSEIEGLYLPLMVSGSPVGVLGVQPRHPDSLASEQQHFLQSLANQIGASIENARLAEETQKSRLQVETEQLRSTLLSSVSHDLRTPLAVITGSASGLLEPGNRLSSKARQELIQDIFDESELLNRLLSNLLEMTKLSTDKIRLKKEIQPLEEILGASLFRLEKKLGDRPVKTNIPKDLPMIPLDSILMEQVFINLIENALKYTPANSPIEISASLKEDFLQTQISDHGPGLEKDEEDHIFEKFYRGLKTGTQGGVGLGLAICKSIVEAHGGKVWAENHPKEGASFYFTLPITNIDILSKERT